MTEYSDIKKYKMSLKAIRLYRLRTVITAILISFLYGGILALFPFFTLILIFITAILFVFVFSIYINLLYQHYSIEVYEDMICITKGVFFLYKYYIQRNDINYIGTVITPLQKALKIFNICLYTKSGKIYLSNIENIPEFLRGFSNE